MKIQKMNFAQAKFNNLYFSCVKKAVNRDFSPSDFTKSLFIAFFIVLFSAYSLNWAYLSLNSKEVKSLKSNNKATKAIYETLAAVLNVSSAQAAASLYEAQINNQTEYLEAKKGQELSLNLKIKNTGTEIWQPEQVFLETGDQFLRSISQVKHPNWLKYYQAASLNKAVKPGETASLDFKFLIPNIQGQIQENFQLVVNNAPILGSKIRYFINIDSAVQEIKPAIKQEEKQAASSEVKKINPVVPVIAQAAAAKTIEIKKSEFSEGELVRMDKKIYVIKNGEKQHIKSLAELARHAGKPIRDIKNTTEEKKVVAAEKVAEKQAEPASNKKDNFKVCISAAGQEADHYPCQTDNKENGLNGQAIKINANLKAEPIIRVGIFNTKDAQRINSKSSFDIYDGANLIFSDVNSSQSAIISFDFDIKQYILTVGGITKFAKDSLRFIPREQNAVMTLADYQDHPRWDKSYNDNQFRNIIEFRYSKETGKLWVINELPISYYLKGLAETSNYSPVEYQKVMATAARSYAMYHYNRGIEYNIPDGSTKHAAEHFHVDSVYDQVYKGYGSEVRLTKLSQAVDETKGVIVTYENKAVITPYFSTSDGHTRTWSEVWGGDDKPWLKNVAVPEDNGKELFGHGVGLSATGALVMTRDEGKTWQETLKYFYQNTELEKIY